MIISGKPPTFFPQRKMRQSRQQWAGGFMVDYFLDGFKSLKGFLGDFFLLAS